MTIPVRRKLIEVSIPLEAINKASAREKSIRHGHPSTLHLWWARRPLAACRAVLFAQLVDDPSAWPDRFPTGVEQDIERKRLHRVIEMLVQWEASNDETVLNAARWEIARTVAWGRSEEPPAAGDGKAILAYLQAKAPPVYDPFSGGGSIPLEAQRLGLRAYGSDLNPVAVLIGKALVEIPPKFAGWAPVNPASQEDARNGAVRGWKAAQGLAEDVRYYGAWMRKEALRRIGHLYPAANTPEGVPATAIAWLWARTVRSPDPSAKGAMVPLTSSFLLSTKEGRKSWVEPVIDASAPDGWRFVVHSGPLAKADEERLKSGTKSGTRANFKCILTGAAIPPQYIKSEAIAGRMQSRMMAIVAEGARGRTYCTVSAIDEQTALQAVPQWLPETKLPPDPRAFTPVLYGFDVYAKLFTSRQLVALTTFSDLVSEARSKVIIDAKAAGLPTDHTPLHQAGAGTTGYADAVATYLAFAVSKIANIGSTFASWMSDRGAFRETFARQALSMTWDFAEANPFADAGGSFETAIDKGAMALAHVPALSGGSIDVYAAQSHLFNGTSVVISTDPPYYDNIGYADLSEFFYVWLRRSLSNIWPELFRRLATPKDAELVAPIYRHGGRAEAETFFMNGMSEALTAMRKAAFDDVPLAIYYAFKQSEVAEEGITSAGWAAFLQAVVDSGLSVDGTWPVRTESAGRMRGQDSNALASSIVLVCRKRLSTAGLVTRADLVRTLKRELPAAIDDIRKAGVGPVDMQQSIIGPGMGVFTRYARVLEDDDSAMNVRTALTLINRVWEEIENELDAAFDPATQVALAWFATYGFDAKSSGELITLANAKNIPLDALFSSGVFQNLHGRAGLIPRNELPSGWTPATDKEPTVWECVQHTARVLGAPEGGAEAAAALVGQMGPMASDARTLAYRLFEIATKKGWAGEALIYNELAEEWPHLEDLVPDSVNRKGATSQADMFEELAR
jgi:putative DNA methylase